MRYLDSGGNGFSNGCTLQTSPLVEFFFVLKKLEDEKFKGKKVKVARRAMGKANCLKGVSDWGAHEMGVKYVKHVSKSQARI